MKIDQILLSRMDTYCYIISDESSGNAALIDPAFDVPKILARAHQSGYTITHVINTHHHADHSAGNAQVLKATGAQLCIHKLDSQGLNHLTNRAFARMLGGKGSPPADRLLSDGDKVTVGAVVLSVLHTPGHTPGGICLYTPGNIFTGDTLFVGAVGRTDLPGGNAMSLVKAIKTKIYTLPDDTVVWPGHHYGDRPSSTVADERSTNPYTRSN